jgi:23S rRNA (guanine745-N1)-methyltransferase
MRPIRPCRHAAGDWFPRSPGTAPERFGGRHYTRVIGWTNLTSVGLACPVCGKPLNDRDSAAACESGHSFDRARSGYLNLMVGRGGSGRVGDTAEMVRARAQALERGHFEPLAEAIAAEAAAVAAAEGSDPAPEGQKSAQAGPGRLVAEIGAGTGYYLARTGGEATRVAIDLSKPAAAHAARAGLVSVVADVEERIPLLDASVDVLLSVFAPRPAAEAARVVSPGGAFVVAMATERHLAGLRGELGLLGVHPGKPEALRERLAGAFEQDHAATVEHEVELAAADVPLLVAMGPNARHGGEPPPARARRDVVSVDVLRFRRLDAAPPDPSK